MVPKSGTVACRREVPGACLDDSYTLWTLFGVPGAGPVPGTPGHLQGPPRAPPGIPPGILQKPPRIFQLAASSQYLHRFDPESFQNPSRIIGILPETAEPPRILSESLQHPAESFQNLPACRIPTVSSQIQSRILPESFRILAE